MIFKDGAPERFRLTEDFRREVFYLEGSRRIGLAEQIH